MKVLVLTRVATDDGRATAQWVGQEFRRAGALVDHCALPDAPAADQPDTGQTESQWSRTQLKQLSDQFSGTDVVAYITDELTIMDVGGPWLRQAASWAERAVVPLIAVAPACDISTRQLRTLGVEAGYSVASPDDARRVAQTWTPPQS